jgi:hypothetical protein
METLDQALARLGRKGFDRDCRARADGQLALAGDDAVAPEDLQVVEVVRFEGESDPSDESLLLALESPDGRIRGTFLAAFGPRVEPATAAVMERLRSGGPD